MRSFWRLLIASIRKWESKKSLRSAAKTAPFCWMSKPCSTLCRLKRWESTTGGCKHQVQGSRSKAKEREAGAYEESFYHRYYGAGWVLSCRIIAQQGLRGARSDPPIQHI